MTYVDNSYYMKDYLLGKVAVLPEDSFSFWEKQAEREIDRFTFGRLKGNPDLVTDEVRDCVCAVAELLYKAEAVAESTLSEGVAGALTSYSNDGQSATYDVSQSVYTEAGKKAEIKRLVYLYLENTGLLYQGVCCCES